MQHHQTMTVAILQRRMMQKYSSQKLRQQISLILLFWCDMIHRMSVWPMPWALIMEQPNPDIDFFFNVHSNGRKFILSHPASKWGKSLLYLLNSNEFYVLHWTQDFIEVETKAFLPQHGKQQFNASLVGSNAMEGICRMSCCEIESKLNWKFIKFCSMVKFECKISVTVEERERKSVFSNGKYIFCGDWIKIICC